MPASTPNTPDLGTRVEDLRRGHQPCRRLGERSPDLPWLVRVMRSDEAARGQAWVESAT